MSQWGWNQHTPEPIAFHGRCVHSRWPQPGRASLSCEISCGSMKSSIVSGRPDLRPHYRYGGETIGLYLVESSHPGDNSHSPRLETPPSLTNCGTSEKCRGHGVLSRGKELNESSPYLPRPQKRMNVNSPEIKLQNYTSGKYYSPCSKRTECP